MSLPNELIDEILHRMPVKYLLRCRCVSKEWCFIIDSVTFIKKHYKRTIECNPDGGVVISGDGKIFLTDVECLRDDNVDVSEINDAFVSGAEFVGVANGLVCLCKDNKNEFVMCNPSTRKFRQIPSLFMCKFKFDEVKGSVCGFGYDHVNDDYKVVKIVECEDCIMVAVYSLKSDSWKRIQDIRSTVLFISVSGKFFGGALHWMVVQYHKNCCGIIFSFDLGLEQFKEVPIPDVHGTAVILLDHAGGSLCLIDKYWDSRTDVWLMNNHGDENSWCKSFSVDQPGTCGTFTLVRPVAFSKSGKDVLLEVDHTKLLWYDLEKKAGKNVRIHGIPVKFDTHLYTESLLRLTEGKQLQKTTQDKKEMKQQ